jgi:hypothetical protein
MMATKQRNLSMHNAAKNLSAQRSTHVVYPALSAPWSACKQAFATRAGEKLFVALFALLFLSLLCCVNRTEQAHAQTPSATASALRYRAVLDSTNIMIGEQTTLRLIAEYDPATVQVTFPTLRDTVMKGVEVLGTKMLDSTAPDGRPMRTMAVTITSFDAGQYTLPQLALWYKKSGDSALYRIESPLLVLNVATVRINPADSANGSASGSGGGSAGIRDIKDPLDVPLTFQEILPYLLFGVAVLLAVAGGVYYWRTKRPQAATAAEAPKIVVPSRPAHELALEELERLQQQRLWQQGHATAYHSRVAEILWAYLEGNYGIKTVEATTDEILAQFHKFQYRTATAVGTSTMLRTVLERADLVKFARYAPLPDEHEQSFATALEFVKLTMPLE